MSGFDPFKDTNNDYFDLFSESTRNGRSKLFDQQDRTITVTAQTKRIRDHFHSELNLTKKETMEHMARYVEQNKDDFLRSFKDIDTADFLDDGLGLRFDK